MRRAEPFSTIRTYGGLLTSELLERIAAGDSSLAGIRPEDYHLSGLRISEAASSSWYVLKAAWARFREARENLQPGDPGTTATRERWLLPLFSALDYGRLETAKPVEIDNKTYAISHVRSGVPFHLVGAGVDLEKRMERASGAARQSPHSLMQEFLNRSGAHLWGVVSNGLVLRILRDNLSFTRQAYIEFDLEAMMEQDVYSDFVLLWMLCHESRLVAENPSDCWLEKWSRIASQEGSRALENLRSGVTKAIRRLGEGFLAYPGNSALLEKLRDGSLGRDAYYRELLRTIYRILFLLVAEARGLLPLEKAQAGPMDRYLSWYSVTRLRELCEKRRGGKHPDLWRGLKTVFKLLGSDAGCSDLALPALGSYLWSDEAAPNLVGCDIANSYLLDAFRFLTIDSTGRQSVRVDFKNLGSEELGSVYESLLELHPDVDARAASFELSVASGHDRKTTGSYYTPTSLVNELIESALVPVIDDRLATARRLASCEWDVVQRTIGGEYWGWGDADPVIQGPGGLAAGDGSRPGRLHPHEGHPEGGAVRDDIPGSQGCGIGSGEHRGGLGEGVDSGVHAVHSDRQGEPEGAGDAPHPLPEGGAYLGGEGEAAAGESGHPEPPAPRSSAQPQIPPLALPSSVLPSSPLLATLHSPLATRPSLLASCWSTLPLPTRYSLLATRLLLDLKVCDPACGSGHFLIAAAHRIGKRLAAVRTGEDEPAPEAIRHAVRDVVSSCIYGVDLNPMAVELCKFNMWLESLEPGMPLSFLDHHFRVGNSLVGATPELIAQGIPDGAFTPVTGDDRDVCSIFRKRNKQERTTGQHSFLGADLSVTKKQEESATFDHPGGERDISEVHRREMRFREWWISPEYLHRKLAADAWCAAFMWPKTKSGPPPVTTQTLRQIEENPASLPGEMRQEIERLCGAYAFFQWGVEFPEVFGKARGEGRVARGGEERSTGFGGGGFDVILGNPPWERIKLQEKEWFAARVPEIANARNKAEREKLIKALKSGFPQLHAVFEQALREAEASSLFIRESGRFPLCGRGDVNTYTIFAELNRNLISSNGRAGCIVPSGIATDDTTKEFFQSLTDSGSLISLFDFENRNAIFPGVHRSYKFCLLTMRSTSTDHSLLAPHHAPPAEFVFFAHDVADLRDPDRRFSLSAEDIALLNPNTRTCPIFRSKKDAELTKAIYRRVPVLIKEARDSQPEENPWGIKFMTMFHMSNDSHLFRTREQLEAEGWRLDGNVFRRPTASGEWGVEEFLPLYEAKMIHHFDHRWATYEGGSKTAKRDRSHLFDQEGEPEEASGPAVRDVSLEEKRNPDFEPLPRYWVSSAEVAAKPEGRWPHNWLLGYRRVCRNTDERSAIFSLLPLCAAGDSVFLIVLDRVIDNETAWLNATCSSLVFDYIARQKVAGINFSFFLMEQLPVLSSTSFKQTCPWSTSESVADWIKPRVLELAYTSWSMKPFAEDLGFDGPPFPWDEEHRFQLRCELDAAFFRLYGCTREDASYILGTFPIIRDREMKKFGSYRTKDMILSIYDAMLHAIDTGEPFQSPLGSPSGDSWAILDN